MRKKKICNRCGKKISERYEFCPYCGNSANENSEENWGILGKDDSMPSFNEIKFPMGMNVIFNSLMKNLDKQFRNLDKEIGNQKKKTGTNPWENKIKKGISISISTMGDKTPKIKINSFGSPEFKQKEQEIKERIKEVPSNLSQGSLKKLASLPKKEPSTNIRRFSDRVIYEMNIPGVKSMSDISIIKLENSIEIKAIAKDQAYFKLIPINLPIINYNFAKGKLVLEFAVKE